MPGSHIGLFRLQCVYAVHVRYVSGAEAALTVLSHRSLQTATDLWLFTTYTTFQIQTL